MKEEPIPPAVLKQFLLGNLNDEDNEKIERLFISDAEYQERILAMEQSLIEDYLDDGLEAADRKNFVLRYGQTAEQRRKLLIVSSLKKYAVAHVVEANATQVRKSRWPELFSKPAYYVPIAASLLVVISVVIFWLNRTNQTIVQNDKIERELAELNGLANLNSVPSQMTSLVLSPVKVRSGTSSTEFVPGANIRFVELKLLWIQKEHGQSYRAELTKIGAGEKFNISGLQLENNDRKIIRLRLPASILTRGVYRISVSGTTGSATASTEEYSFTVTGLQ